MPKDENGLFEHTVIAIRLLRALRHRVTQLEAATLPKTLAAVDRLMTIAPFDQEEQALILALDPSLDNHQLRLLLGLDTEQPSP